MSIKFLSELLTILQKNTANTDTSE